MSKTIYQLAIEQEQIKRCDLLMRIVNDYYSLLRRYYRGFQDFSEQDLIRDNIEFLEGLQSVSRERSLAIMQDKKEELLALLQEIPTSSQSFPHTLNALLKSETNMHIDFCCYFINVRYLLLIEYYLMSFNDDDIRRARDLVSEKDYFSRNVANITSNNEKLSILLNKKDELLQRIKDIIDMPIGILHA